MIQWINLLSSAVIIAGCAFLVRFFGSSIADQKPYSDDRKWDVDLLGVNFFVRALLPWSIIGFVVARYLPIPLDVFLWRLTALTALSTFAAILTFIISALGKQFYNLKDASILEAFNVRSNRAVYRLLIKYEVYLPSFVIMMFAAYLLTNFYYSNHPVWTAIATIETFTCAWYMAIRSSYHMLNKQRSRVTVYLTDGTVLQDVTLLKLNSTNIRLRDGDRVKIVNIDFLKMLEASDDERR